MTTLESSSPAPAPTPLLTLGNPVLRQIAQPVVAVDDGAVQQLIDQLLVTVRNANGVGIAAPQLGHSLRILVIASRPNLRYPHAPLMEPTVLINPRLVAASDEMGMGWEGCLSVPGMRGQVPRHQTVEVEYCDRHGQPHRQIWEGFVARIFQHEVDHLEGKVFLDRVQSEADLLTEAAYQAMEIAALG
ncbi:MULTISPECIES: peptide deformylase [Cyanophyceae]|uniref:peptide deformylase n=1 Tax=Cyanophyceae TaxID=3028117 RepID=UPI001689BC20|nr:MULTISPECIES: peptide deformylase [Cyanophyceae]MBD1915417.1 peptide deformylase [Phormidium sp. FACHB-77]MBD2032418.1 peptide deformylase [Phormidium sp. FACHB-322]MBD2052589.1 peptide deformylase [Leptolyngbya sp. FACHB-60]